MQAQTVKDSFCVLVNKNFDRIQGSTSNGISRKDSIRDHRSQIGSFILREVTADDVLSCFSLRQGIGLIVNQISFFNSFGNQCGNLILCGRGINKKLRISLKIVVVNIDGDFLLTVVSSADGFQFSVNVEQFAGFLPVNIDFIIADIGIFLQQLYDSIHPNFTFTFSAGPPSLTRTHSL